MIPARLPVLRSVLVAFITALAVAGCASGRKTGAEVVTMEPIPNPPEPAARAASKPAAPARRTTARAAKAPATTAAAPAPRPAAQATANPARAAQLRAAGLEQLNRGSVGQAVTLLRQASQLDPNNALIRRDLDRAVRISQAVQAKSR